MKTKQAFIYKLKWDVMHSNIPVAHKTLMIAIAVHSTHDGTGANPSEQTLAEMCDCHKRTISRQIGQLQTAGWLEVTARGVGGKGWSRSSEYRLTIGRNFRLIADPHLITSDVKTRNKKVLVEFIDVDDNVVPMQAKATPKAKAAPKVPLEQRTADPEVAFDGFGTGLTVDEVADDAVDF